MGPNARNDRLRARDLARMISLIVIVMAAATGPVGASPAGAPTTEAAADPAIVATARSVVETAMRNIVATLRNGQLTQADKAQSLRRVVDEHVDFRTLARLSLGQSWRNLSEAKQAEFIQVFRQHVLGVIDEGIDGYTDEDVALDGDGREADGDWTVHTRVLGRKRADGTRPDLAKLDCRMRKNGQRWQAIDLSLDGLSLVVIFRAQFQAVLAEDSIDRLLQIMREKNAMGSPAKQEAKPAR